MSITFTKTLSDTHSRRILTERGGNRLKGHRGWGIYRRRSLKIIMRYFKKFFQASNVQSNFVERSVLYD
jgi:hypothetical protein